MTEFDLYLDLGGEIVPYANGPHRWSVGETEQLLQSGQFVLLYNRADADRVRSWLSPDDGDRVIKVYAAVVGTDPRVERTSAVALLGPGQVADWLQSLPPQKSFDSARRDSLVKQVRSAL